MSGTLPTSPSWVSQNLVSDYPTLISIAQSGRRQVRQFGGHRWSVTAVYSGLTKAEFMPIFSFVLAQQGQYESFQVVLPDMDAPRGVGTGTPKVAGAGQSGRSISTDGWTVSTTNIMRAGDLIKFANHTKVYMLTADTNSDSGGVATLNVEPSLTEAIGDNEAITVNNVPFTMHLNNSVQQYTAGSPAIYNYEIDMIEALN